MKTDGPDNLIKTWLDRRLPDTHRAGIHAHNIDALTRLPDLDRFLDCFEMARYIVDKYGRWSPPVDLDERAWEPVAQAIHRCMEQGAVGAAIRKPYGTEQSVPEVVEHVEHAVAHMPPHLKAVIIEKSIGRGPTEQHHSRAIGIPHGVWRPARGLRAALVSGPAFPVALAPLAGSKLMRDARLFEYDICGVA